MDTNELYDILIVGAGTAGLTAAIYSARAKRKTLVLDRKRPGGMAATTERMENYPGFPGGIHGKELMKHFADQAKEMGACIEKGEVSRIDQEGDIYVVITSKGVEYRARALILAPGCEPRKLGIAGEMEFSGRGVSYCATCDAELYEGTSVLVIGSGDSAVEEAVYLSRFADEVIMAVVHDEGVLDCNRSMAEEAFTNKKLTWMWNRLVTSIDGEDFVTGVTVKNLKTGESEKVACDGVFMFVGTVPQTKFLEGFVEMKGGFILHDEQMETNRPKVYTAGDSAVTVLRQVVTAAADGAKAAFFADRILCEEEEFRRAIDRAGDAYLVYFYTPPVQRSLDLIPEAQRISEERGVPLVKLDTSRFKNAFRAFSGTKIPSLYSVVKNPSGDEVGYIEL